MRYTMLKELVRRVRRNHALEHACVTLMLDAGCEPPLGGYSTPGGFFIIGGVETEELARIASEALGRLNAGQSDLAVSRHCGTNLATAALIAGLLTRLLLGGRKVGVVKRLPLMAVAAVAGALLSRPVGNAIQRRFTTLADMDGVEIVAVARLWPGPKPRLHRVRTRMPD